MRQCWWSSRSWRRGSSLARRSSRALCVGITVGLRSRRGVPPLDPAGRARFARRRGWSQFMVHHCRQPSWEVGGSDGPTQAYNLLWGILVLPRVTVTNVHFGTQEINPPPRQSTISRRRHAA